MRQYSRVPITRNSYFYSPFLKGAKGIFLLLLLAFQTSAQPYEFDTSFVPAYDYNYQYNILGSVEQIYEHSIGEVLTVGNYNNAFFDPQAPADLVRLEPSGRVDSTFYHSLLQSVDADSYSTYLLGKIGQNYWIKRNYNIRMVDMAGNVTGFAYTDTLNSERAFRHFGLPLLLSDERMVMATYGGLGENGWPYPPSNPTDTFQIVRILPTGKVDTSFRHSVNLPYIGRVLAYDSSHWLVEANSYVTTYDGHNVANGQYTSRLFRTDTAGNFDTTFALPPWVYGVAGVLSIQSDGKIIIGGNFDLPGFTYCMLARLNTDGTIDTSFNIAQYPPWATFPSAKNYYIRTICETSDGGLLVGGQFEEFDGRPRNCLALLDANGNLDTTVFEGVAGMDSTKYGDPNNQFSVPRVYGITRSKIDDTYYVYGLFNRYNNQSVQPIIRLHGPNYLSTGIGANVERERLDIGLYPNPAKEEVNLRLGLYNGNGIRYTLHDMLGRPVGSGQVQGMETRISLRGLSEGLYIVSVSDEKRVLDREKLMVR